VKVQICNASGFAGLVPLLREISLLIGTPGFGGENNSGAARREVKCGL
jgi:hypothetical protein